MNQIKNKFKIALLTIFFGAVLLTSCNKDIQQFAIPQSAMATGITLDSTLKNSDNDSMYYRLIVKASLGPTNFVNLLKGVGSVNNTYTLFVPDNAAMIASGFSSAVISAIPIASAVGIVSYNTIPQTYDTASIPNVFPNFPVGTLIFPAPSAPFLTFRTYPSKRPGILRVNTLPMTTPLNVKTANGIIHHVAGIVAPPNPSFLWNRINTDVTPSTGLTYLRAAILRADSGTGTPGTLQSALQNAAANLTVFAPIDAVFQGTLTALITQGLIAQGVPSDTAAAQAVFLASTPAVFSNPLLYSTLTATTIKGILVYHLFSNTAFTVNFPMTPTKYPTLLNSAIPSHPGIELTATFSGPFVSAATVKGLGNATAANIIINPAANGSSDQFYINGVLHKITRLLIPQ